MTQSIAIAKKIISQFPVIPGAGIGSSWTFKALKSEPQTDGLVHGVVSVLGQDRNAHKRYLDIRNQIVQAEKKNGPGAIAYAIGECERLARCVAMEQKFALGMAAGTAALVMGLIYHDRTGAIPALDESGNVVGFGLKDDGLDEKQIVAYVQWAINEGATRSILKPEDLSTLILGEAESAEEEAAVRLIPDFGMGITAYQGLVGGNHPIKRADAEDIAAKLLMLGMGQSEEEKSVLFQGLTPLVPEDLTSSYIDIRDHATYSLWPGITEVYWEEGPLRRVRLYPTTRGEVKAVVELQVDDTTVITPRIVPAPTDATSWDDIIRNHYGDEEGGYADPIAIAIEAVRACLVAKERKVRSDAPHRIPTGLVSSGKKPTKKDVAMRYVPRYQIDREMRAPSSSVKREHHEGGKRAHMVAGHIRQIPMDHHASDQCVMAASEAGISLPTNGFTFVRPHVRGGGEKSTVTKVKIRRRTKE